MNAFFFPHIRWTGTEVIEGKKITKSICANELINFHVNICICFNWFQQTALQSLRTNIFMFYLHIFGFVIYLSILLASRIDGRKNSDRTGGVFSSNCIDIHTNCSRVCTWIAWIGECLVIKIVSPICCSDNKFLFDVSYIKWVKWWFTFGHCYQCQYVFQIKLIVCLFICIILCIAHWSRVRSLAKSITFQMYALEFFCCCCWWCTDCHSFEVHSCNT